MRTARDLTRLARRHGMTVEAIAPVTTPGGRQVLASRMRFEDPWAAAGLLVDMTREDMGDPQVRAWALAMLAAERQGMRGPTVTADTRDALAAAIHRNVRDQIAFVHEKGEVFQGAAETMELGAGDCDDHAHLVCSLAGSVGIPSRLVFFEEDGQPVHAVGMLGTSAGMQWAETTLRARFGEHPVRALRRLGPDAAANPLSHTRAAAMGDFGFGTATDVDTYKQQLNATMVATNNDVAKCEAIDASTRGAWSLFYAAWGTFLSNEAHWYNAGAQGRQAAQFAADLRQWQQRVEAVCPLSAPVIEQTSTDAQVFGTIKTVAIVIGVAAAAWGLYEVSKTTRLVVAR